MNKNIRTIFVYTLKHNTECEKRFVLQGLRAYCNKSVTISALDILLSITYKEKDIKSGIAVNAEKSILHKCREYDNFKEEVSRKNAGRTDFYSR